MPEEINPGFTIMRKQPRIPVRTLVTIPYQSGSLTFTPQVFGPDYFANNVSQMRKDYQHPYSGEKISFKEPTTPQSLAIASFMFANRDKATEFAGIRKEVSDPRWLQLGNIIRTSEGVYAGNLPRDGKGEIILDNDELRSHWNKLKPVDGIYLTPQGLAFTEYGFKTGEQSHEDFSEGRLARVLAASTAKPTMLKSIANNSEYPKGVYVYNFDKVRQPTLAVVGLGSGRGIRGGGLDVDGYWDGSYGCAFGVFDVSGADARKNSQ